MRPVSQKSWLVVALISIILFGLFFYMILVINKRLVISLPVYFFLIIIIDLGATAFLAGAMRSVARYQVHTQNKSLYLAGPAVIFFIILYIGYKYRPEPEKMSISLSVLLTDAGDKPLTKGTVYLRGSSLDIKDSVNNRGSVQFSGIVGEYRGKQVDIFVSSPGYHTKGRIRYQFSESDDFNNLTIAMEKDVDSIYVQGRVINLPSRIGISHAVVAFEGASGRFYTDSTGNFAVTLPFKSGIETRVIVVKNNKEIYNSLRTLTDKSFLNISPN